MEIDAARSAYTLLADPLSSVDEWLDLCTIHEVRGVRAHDVRLVALMKANGIAHLLTLNPSDFRAFHEIVVVTPHAIDLLVA